MKLASFDIETATPIPKNCKEWETLGPLGISCAAFAFNDNSNIEIWQNPKRLTRLQLPEPDTSWMSTTPPSRNDFIKWMPIDVA